MNIAEALNVILKTSGFDKLKKSAVVGAFTVATDGHRLLALTGRHTDEAPHADFPLKAIAQWLEETPTGSRVAMAALRDFIGSYVVPVTCDECDGAGTVSRGCVYCEHSHRCECQDCDKGRVGTKIPVKIGKAVFNAHLLSELFPYLPEDGDVLICVLGESDQIRIYGDGWFYFVMPMRDTDPIRVMELSK